MPTLTAPPIAPDVLFVQEARWHWIICPVSSDARLWLADSPFCDYQEGGTYIISGFDNAVRVFDGLCDAGMVVG